MKKSITLLAICLFGFGTTFAQTQTFNYTGTMQTFTVPANVFSITFDMAGGQGGNAMNLSQSPNFSPGGNGGRVQATLSVNPNDVLNIYVGGKGVSDSLTLTCQLSNGGFNGGGYGQGGYNSYNYNAGGGGGASDVRLNGTSLTSRVVVAGGGGGASCSGCTGGGTYGGAGGGLTGQDGETASCSPCNNGKGGSQTAGGVAGAWACQCTNADTGSLGLGGRANDSANCTGGVTCGSGGGGGGGYYGGGGGNNGPGGGGSSYVNPSATGVTHTQGYQAGNGYVTITYTVFTGTDLISQDKFVNIYPNPSNDHVTIDISLTDPTGEISVINMMGENVFNTTTQSVKTELDLSLLSPGIYFVKIELPGATVVKKLVKN